MPHRFLPPLALTLSTTPCRSVVKLLFSFATAKHIYMIMEYLPGGDCLTLLLSYGFLEEPLTDYMLIAC